MAAGGPGGPNQTAYLKIGDLNVEVVRKNTSRVRLGVNADGQVRAIVPLKMSLIEVRHAILQKQAWTVEPSEEPRSQPKTAGRRYWSNEWHYFEGYCYRLEVIESTDPDEYTVDLNDEGGLSMEMHIWPGSDSVSREKMLYAWYRGMLRRHIPELAAHWEPRIGIRVKDWRVRRVKRSWVTTSPAHQGVWLNTELAKAPLDCIEYIVVLGMLSLKYPKQEDKEQRRLDELMPDWRQRAQELVRIHKDDRRRARRGAVGPG